LEKSPFPLGVNVEGDMLSKFVSLKFVDHDITDENKFYEMFKKKYLCSKRIQIRRAIFLEMQMWTTRLENLGIMNLFDAAWKSILALSHFSTFPMEGICGLTHWCQLILHLLCS
jgi:hypothetical protein